MTIARVQTGAEIAARALPLADWGWQAQVAPVVTVLAGDLAGETTEADIVYDEFTSANVLTEAQVSAELPAGPPEGGASLPQFSFSSLDTNVATVDSSGRVTRVADGTAQVRVKGPYGAVKVTAAVSLAGGGTSQAFNRYAAGSLNAYLADVIDAAIDGLAAGQTTQALFTSDSGNGGNRRTTNFLHGVCDLSPWVARKMNGAWWMPGTVVTRNAVLFVNHFKPLVGETLEFVAPDNTRHQRTCTAVAQIGAPYLDEATDSAIAILNAPLPDSIDNATVMPADWQSTFPSVHLTQTEDGLPQDLGPVTVYSDFRKWVNIADWRFYGLDPLDSDLAGGHYTYFGKSVSHPDRAPFWRQPIPGDSGNTACLVIDGRLCILATQGGAGPSGRLVGNWLDPFNEVLDALGGGELELADLSAFNTYEGS